MRCQGNAASSFIHPSAPRSPALLARNAALPCLHALMPLLFLLLLLLLFGAATAAVTPPRAAPTLSQRSAAQREPDCRRDARWQPLYPEFKGYCDATRNKHVFFVSSGAPLARALPAGAAADVRFFLEQMAHVGRLAREKRAADFLAPACALPSASAERNRAAWLRGSNIWANSMGLPRVRSHCLTEVSHAPASAKRTMARIAALNAATERGARALRANRPREAAGRFVADWREFLADVVAPFTRNPVFRCDVRHVTGVRIRGAWSVLADVINTPLGVSRREGSRVHLTELLHLDARGKVAAARVTTYEEGRADRVHRDTTTWKAVWGGYPSVTAFKKQPLGETPAVRGLMNKSQRTRALVQETVFGSNVAILVLPIFMTLVPISYIEYVQTPMVFLYGAFTDVLSTLPLLVKGLELLGLEDSTGCDSWVHGVEAKNLNSTVIIETWCAICSPRVSFRAYGYAFISGSLFFMAVGVFAEFYSRQRLMQKMKRGAPLPRRFWSWAERENPKMYRRKPAEKCALCICGDDNMHVRWGSTRESYEKNAVTSLGWRRLEFFEKG